MPKRKANIIYQIPSVIKFHCCYYTSVMSNYHPRGDTKQQPPVRIPPLLTHFFKSVFLNLECIPESSKILKC